MNRVRGHGRVCKKKSGLHRKASDQVISPQAWPHLSLKLEYSSCDLGFKELTISTFVAGELEIIGNCKNEVEKEARVQFLTALMYDAAQYNFEDILKFYAAWVREVELGNRKWVMILAKSGNLS